MEGRIKVGVDIGTTKVCAVVAEKDELDNKNVRGVGLATCKGLNRGVVVNIDRTVDAVHEAIRDASRAADFPVHDVIVGVAGDHVQSSNLPGVVTITSKEQVVSAHDVRRLREETEHVAQPPPDREFLHVIPQEFVVDGQDGVQDPVGMNGVRLEADVHIVTGLASAVKNIRRCTEKAGYHVSDIVVEPLASSFSVLYDDEKEVGVAVIDIGGGTTDIAVIKDHEIRHTAVIAVAGSKVTDDIRLGLSLMREHAEQLKCRFGSALAEIVEEDQEIMIPGIGGRPETMISQSALAQVIQPRMEEILEFAHREIKRSGIWHLRAGVVVTGGGSLIPGTPQLAEEVMGMEARVGYPIPRGGGLWEEVNNPQFATAVGLALYGFDSNLLGPYAKGNGDVQRVEKRSLVQRMREWFDEL